LSRGSTKTTKLHIYIVVFPKEYTGVGMESGKYVDVILHVEKLVKRFGEKAFDVIISTELVELI